MAAGLILGMPPQIVNIVQNGLIERGFHDALFPAMSWRAEAEFEDWPDAQGTEMYFTRQGLLPPITRPLKPATDPNPQLAAFEQWYARLARYGGTIDTHMPTSAVAISNLFMRNVQQLGMQAGQSLNRIARNELFKAYLGGHTVLTFVGASGDTAIKVASLNGFTDVVIAAGSGRPAHVSPASPLPITIATVTGTRNVIGAIPDNPDDPWGPGTLILDAALGSAPVVRSAVLSSQRSTILRSGGGASIDAIIATDTFLLTLVFAAVAELRKQNVPPHEDGWYHGHITNDGNSQVFSDPAFQALNRSLPDGVRYKEGFIGSFSNVLFFLEQEAPDYNNVGPLTLTTAGQSAVYGEEIGAEVRNAAGVNIGRVIITGRGALYERGFDEKNYLTDVGVTGKMGEFQVVNNGMSIKTDRISLIMRSPINRLQDTISSTWSCTTSFPIPSDVLGGTGGARFKRAVIIEHALNS